MAVTPNYGWPVPVATDYVKDGWEAISDLGNAIDTTVAGLGSGLTLIKTQTVGSAVSSVAVTNAFSADYVNYLVTYTDGVASTNLNLRITLGATTTGYYGSLVFGNISSNTVDSRGQNNQAYVGFTGFGSTNGALLNCNIMQPYLARNTYFYGSYSENVTTAGAWHGHYSNFLNNNTSYTDFTIATSVGNITGGVIRVYGYQNS